MEEDGGAKAPVTRLRRRMSVEGDDSRSPTPSTVTTPTKKRGRLAAKPQLDLIEENDIPESPSRRTTRKSISRDIDTEEKLTPARRSTRIRSNTSLIDNKETETEEKVTPGRKTTRNRSNTSILEIPSINVNSPRAKRAVRRSSLLGSDTETPTLTPTTRSRRARKGSTSSSDIQATPRSGTSVNETQVTPASIKRGRETSLNNIDDKDVPMIVIEVIPEEQDNNDKQVNKTFPSTPDSQESSPVTQNSQKSLSATVRKSPRLMLKKSRDGGPTDKQDDEIIEESNTKEQVNNYVETPDITAKPSIDIDQTDGEITQPETLTSVTKDELSISSASLISKLDNQPKKRYPGANKSLSAIDVKNTPKRHRTKSCTTLSVSPPSEENFHSDNERNKKKLVQNSISSLKQMSVELSKTGHEVSNDIQIFEVASGTKNSLRKKKKPIEGSCVENSIQESINLDKTSKEKSLLHTPNEADTSTENRSLLLSPKILNTSNDSNKENLDEINAISNASNAVKRLFEKDPTISIKSLEFIEDSDSGSVETKETKTEDQCVPVAYEVKSNDNPAYLPFAIRNNDDHQDDRSIEPMDIDETMPEGVSFTAFTASRSRNSSLSVPQDAQSKNKESKRKSSGSNNSVNALEQPRIENKSPIVLSELNVINESDANASESRVFSHKSKRKSSMSKDFDKSPNDKTSSITNLESKHTESNAANPHEVNPEKLLTKNVLLNCLTSTPVQDKDSKQQHLSVNTSVVTPIIENKKKKQNNSKNITMPMSSESDDDSDEDSSKDKSNMIDDEAMEAGDDYQSGDSLNEEERQYIKDHEITEKGETLTSDDENLSTDSEYEKDSFLVSSDDEDNELLSGSGEDLDMSDNELTMSKKSKRKYDDRKSKEQKKASKEMFEARHGKKSSEDSKEDQPKNNNSRVRFDSTLLDSGDDNKVPPKKNKRMRLESDASFARSDADKTDTKNDSTIAEMDEIGYKKKKSKRLSESLYNDSVLNEKEVTINGENVDAQEHCDPLTVAVKQEPKTPQKLDISTIHFTDRAEVEQVEVPENVTIIKVNETSDPLQTSIAENGSDEESISENEEATKNYESILDNLNNQHKLKSRDTSLNLDKKTKQTKKELIVEELNITTTKEKIVHQTSPEKKTAKLPNNKADEVDESSSDSMDLKLLFSDESNDGHKDNKDKVEITTKIPEKIIPLKRCEGKTNLRQSLSSDDVTETNDPNNSKKKHERKSSQTEIEIVTSFTGEDDEVNFFIDTVGTYGDAVDGTTASLDVSSKKDKHKKQKKDETSDEDGPPTEISWKKNKINEITVGTDGGSTDGTTASNNLSSKKKKLNKQKKDESSGEVASPIQISCKKNKINEITFGTDGGSIDGTTASLDVSSKKNKKQKKDETSGEVGSPIGISLKKNKIKDISILYDEVIESPTNIKGSKKNKHEKQEAPFAKSDMNNDTSLNIGSKNKTDALENEIAVNSSKKKKNKKHQQSVAAEDTIDSPIISSSSMKSNTKKAENYFMNETTVDTSISVNPLKHRQSEAKLSNENPVDSTSHNTMKKKKAMKADVAFPNEDAIDVTARKISKKTKKVETIEAATLTKDKETVSDNLNGTLDGNKAKTKRKRKSSSLEAEEAEISNIFSPERKQKKPKLAINADVTSDAVGDDANAEQSVDRKKKRRKRRNKKQQSPVETQGEQSRKRKQRDEDDSTNESQVKANSLDKAHVPRLPDTLLNQLADKPRREVLESKKAMVSAVSTTEFIVDEVRRRKNMPSNYLEESVYLNDYQSPAPKKLKLVKNKPKILPFIPVASTSDEGFTTSFQVRVLADKMEFKAEPQKELDFKTAYLQNRKSTQNKLLYKKNKRVNLAKF